MKTTVQNLQILEHSISKIIPHIKNNTFSNRCDRQPCLWISFYPHVLLLVILISNNEMYKIVFYFQLYPQYSTSQYTEQEMQMGIWKKYEEEHPYVVTFNVSTTLNGFYISDSDQQLFMACFILFWMLDSCSAVTLQSGITSTTSARLLKFGYISPRKWSEVSKTV